MNRIFHIMKWEFIIRVRTNVFLLSLFIPLLILGVSFISTALLQKGSDTEIRVGIVDETELLGKAFATELQKKYQLENGEEKYSTFDFEMEDEAKIALSDKSIDVIIMIPSYVLESSNAFYFARSLSNFILIKEINQTLSETVISHRIYEKGIDAKLIEEVGRSVHMDLFEVNQDGKITVGDDSLLLLGPFFFVLLLVLSVFMNGQLLLRSVIEERTNRIIEILLSIVSPKEIMMGKIFGLGLLGLVQISVYILMGIGFGFYKEMEIIHLNELPILLLYFILGYFFFAAIYATVGTLFDSEQDAQQSMSVIGIIAMAPVIGSFYFMANPDATITKVLSFFPPMTPFMMILRMGNDYVETWEIYATIFLMIFSVWLMMNIAGKIFKTALLMVGKRITLPEIWRWIKV